MFNSTSDFSVKLEILSPGNLFVIDLNACREKRKLFFVGDGLENKTEIKCQGR